MSPSGASRPAVCCHIGGSRHLGVVGLNRSNCCTWFRRFTARGQTWHGYLPDSVVQEYQGCARNPAIRCWPKRAASEQRLQGAKPRQVDARTAAVIRPRGAGRPIEHPGRQFQPAARNSDAPSCSVQHSRRPSRSPHGCGRHVQTKGASDREPRALQSLGPVGVPSSRCTIAAARIRALTA